jgi:hypothetical protein
MKFLGRRILPAVLFLACVGLAGRAQDQPRQQHVGRVQDWSYRHMVLSGGLPAADLGKAQAEPRMLFRLAERNLHRASVQTGVKGLDRGDRGPRRRPRPRNRDLKIDWSVPLGTGIVAPYMFPAKYSFNINDTPNCTNDYVVYGLNVAGTTGGQANLIGLRNLYSGTNPAGLCSGAAATFYWAYNGSTATGSVLTSPVVSLDGTKVAYVESAAGSAVFHILKWKSGEGTSATASAAPTLNGACTATSSCLKSVTFSATSTATLASPWVDYSTDKAFVGSDDGKIYRISCVFNCALNTQPVVDWTFTLPVAGTGGASATPNGPVYDSQTGHLIVGDQLGELWTINASGATPTLFAGPVMIGGGGCTTTHPPGRTGTAPGPNCTGSGGSYGIPDSVILDGSVGKVFAFSGNDGNGGASAVVAQLNENLTGLVRVHVGLGSVGTTVANWNIHSGAFDDVYFGATPANGHLFMCGTAANSRQPTHYWIGFDAYPTMNATPDGSLLRLNVNNLPCAPYTELYNPNLTLSGGPNDHDLLISGLVGAGNNGYIITNDISTGIITAGEDFVNYPGGVSGIVVDNTSSAAQASSVYFSTQGVVTVGTCVNSRCAVKLTQSGLQ